MLCPCGSELYFSICCETPMQGKTLDEIKKLVRRCMVRGFKNAGDVRGELCLYASLVAKDLLALHGIKSYVVLGSAAWEGYPIFYQWKPNGKEFHAWLVTQYGEYVDLTIDDIESRRDFESTDVFQIYGYSIDPPTWCWTKSMSDRNYVPYDIGAKTLEIDYKAYELFKNAALKVHVDIVK